MSLPVWVRYALRSEGRERIVAAVAAAEKRTRGQIVPMVVRQSAGAAHVPLTLAALILALFFLLRIQVSYPWLPWGQSPWLGVALDLVLALVAGYAGAKIPRVRRFLTPNADRHRAAWLRAETAFYRHGLDRTKGSTGILLFISLADRQAIVLADKAIAAKVPPEVWDEVCEMLLRGARQGDLANGFQAAIQRCASVLEKHFPVKGRHPNELADKLIVEN